MTVANFAPGACQDFQGQYISDGRDLGRAATVEAVHMYIHTSSTDVMDGYWKARKSGDLTLISYSLAYWILGAGNNLAEYLALN